MESSMRLLIAAAVAFGLVAQGAYAQTPPAEQAANPQKSFRMPASEQKNIAGNPSWTAPQKPFRIYGNTWYAGPHDLGIDLHDIKWILNTHAHSDHAGGLAQLAHDTGAQVIAGAADAPLLERGG